MLLPLQGVTNERALTQGVASLALGAHWAFSLPQALCAVALLELETLVYKNILQPVHTTAWHYARFVTNCQPQQSIGHRCAQ